MTREDARMELQDAKDGYKEFLSDDAINVAIKALEDVVCDDCISREHLLGEIASLKESPWFKNDTNGAMAIRKEAIEIVEDLCIRKEPSVKPKEPKTGHWEQYGNSWEDKFKCSECGKEQPKILCGERIIGHWSDYCPNCGCRMVESEDE